MRFRWADCELDREARTLERAGEPVRVQPLVLDLLLLLLHHRGRVVSEAFLRRKLWRDVQVSDASLRRLLKEARRAIGDDGEKQQQIQTVRGRGIRFAAEVATDDGFDTSFVGRGDVVEALERKLEEVAGGLGGVTLLHGPAGIGKTRTLVEFEARADLRGFRVLHGAGRAEAEGDAFHPWLDVAHDLGVDAFFRGETDDATRSRDASNADARRYSRFRAVSHALARAARERPILIALDDLQLADRDGLEALRFLAPALVRAPVWIIGAYRTGGGARTEEALRALAALGAESSTQDVALRGLAATELRSLVGNQLRAEVGAPLAALLEGRADGNPLFSLEIARSLQRDGHSLAAGLAPDVAAKFAQGIEPLLARRLSALPADAQQSLRAAAALGNPFDAAVVEAAEGVAPGAFGSALDACESAGLLEAVSPGRWRFAHPLFAEAIYGELVASGNQAAAAQHLRIAEACQRLGIDDPFLLARQFLRARPVVSATTALAHVHAAARAAWRRSALADADFWYAKAVALADEGDLAPSERCDLLLEQGDALLGSAGPEFARESLDRAAQIALGAGDRRRLAMAALAYAHRPFPLGAIPRVLDWLRAAQAAPCDDASLRARVSSRLGAELIYLGPAFAAESRDCIAEGVAAARALGEPYTLGCVLLDLSASEFSARETRSRIAIEEEIERLGRASGDLEIEFRGLHGRATGHLELGERDHVEAVHQACRGFIREHLSRYARSVTRGIGVMLALLDGRWSAARAAIEESERDAHALRSTGIAMVVGVQRMVLAMEEGGASAALPWVDRTRAAFPRLQAATAFASVVHARSGGIDAAREALSLVVNGLPALPHDRARLMTLVFAAETAYRVGMRDAAAALEPELAPFAASSAVLGNAAVYFGSVSQGLGWLAAARGDARGAVEHFQRALQTHEALRSAPWSARSAESIEEVRERASGQIAGSK